MYLGFWLLIFSDSPVLLVGTVNGAVQPTPNASNAVTPEPNIAGTVTPVANATGTAAPSMVPVDD